MRNTINITLAIEAQAKYCKDNDLPHFAPFDGVCWSCGNQIYEKISVEEAGSKLITGCPRCCSSYCD